MTWLLLALLQADLPTAPPGWKVEILARAPDVRHPAAVAVGPDGRVYVGEDPQDMEGPVDAKIGRVLCLHPDGRRTVFAEGLGPVFGLAWHAERLYVHDCFRLAAYRDEGGVGRDPREILPATHPEPSRGNRYNTHIPAGFRLSPDGFFYLASGDKGIPDLRGPDGRTLRLRGGGVIRFRPDGTGLEVFATGLRNAIDVAITRQGHVFAFDNDDNALWGARVIHVVEGGDYGYPWDRGRPWVLPAIQEGRGIPAGCVAATGTRLPAEWQDAVLLCEWGRSEVIRYRFEPAGASFRLAARETVFRRGGEEFRPVGIAAGADGRSFVVTDWNTAARRVKAVAGRVLRFTWTGAPGAPPVAASAPVAGTDPFARHAADLELHRKIAVRPETLDSLPAEAIGQALRGIYDPRAVALAARAGDLELLGELLFKPRPWDGSWWGSRAATNPPARPDVAWEGTQAARAALAAALDDPSVSRRRLAVRALRTDRASGAALRKRLEGELDPAARRDLFGALVSQSDPEVETLAARAIEAADPALLAAACAAVRSPEPATRALERRADPLLLATLARTRGPQGPAVRLLRHESAEVRAAAMQALADLGAREAVPELIALGAEALPALVRLPDPRALDLYVAGLAGRAAEARIGCARAIEALGKGARAVLEARADALPEAALAELQRIYAASPEGPLFRRKIERSGREALLSRALEAPGAATRGRALFHDPALLGCSRCHWAEGRGGDIGPELDMVGAVYDRRTLAEGVLFPSKIIHGAYRQTSLRLRSGDVVSGLLRKETPDGLVLLDAEGRTWTLRKADVEARKLAETSTMPEGLADALTPDEFADLVAYLAALRGEQAEFRRGEGRLEIVLAGEAVGTYEWADRTVLRPFFANLRAGGVPLTRAHPPVEGRDAVDHATMHPGAWLAFGDLSGSDFWRNKGKVEHVRFVEEPRDGSFTVLNRYRSGDRTVAEETCRVTVRPSPEGFMLVIDSRLVPVDGPLVFGDQEEMGLGVRLATPLTVKAGGRLLDSERRLNERQVWGKTADWCDYSGTVEGRRCGLLVLPDPANFRKSWMHARDYGLLVANPFGRKAFSKGEPSRVEVKKGEDLRLRFAVLAYRSASPDGPDLPAAARALAAALTAR